MIVYKRTNGLASDLRYEQDDYQLKAGELSIPGWSVLPEIDSLSDTAALEARGKRQALEDSRARALAAINEARLQEALADPDAPPEVKEYAAALADSKVL